MRQDIKERIKQVRHGEAPEEYKKTKIGVKPNDWNEIKFSDIFQPHDERTDDTTLYPLFSLTIENGVVQKTERYERSFLVTKKSESYKVVSPRDFVYNPMNLRFGAIAQYKGKIDVSVSGYYDIFKIVNDFNNVYLEAFLKSDEMIRYYNEMASGSLIEKQRVHFSQFRQFKLPIASIDEQNKIAEILTCCDKVIGLKTRFIEEKRKQKKWLMQNLLDPDSGVRLKGFERSKWQSASIGNVVRKIVGGGTPSRDNEANYNGTIPWATVKDLADDFYKNDTIEHISIEAIKTSSTKLIEPNCFIISTRMGIGRGFINIVTMAINQDLKALSFSNEIDVIYFAHWYKSNALLERLSNGSTVKGIDLNTLKRIEIVYPSIPEQTAIANVLSTADREIKLLEQELAEWQAKKKALMQLLLTGLVRV